MLWLLLVSVRSLVSFSLHGHKFRKQAKKKDQQGKCKKLEAIITQDFQLKKTLLTCKLSQIKSCSVVRASSSEILSYSLCQIHWSITYPATPVRQKDICHLTFSQQKLLRKNTTAFRFFFFSEIVSVYFQSLESIICPIIL